MNLFNQAINQTSLSFNNNLTMKSTITIQLINYQIVSIKEQKKTNFICGYFHFSKSFKYYLPILLTLIFSQLVHNQSPAKMKIFKQKYLYNSQNPIFTSPTVKTYNCMNTQTKNNRLLLLQHLTDPPQIQNDNYTLQPLESPTILEPYSVYPLVNCCSEIGKISQTDAMYILQCLVTSKTKNSLYYVISPQGIVCSQVEGLLPSRSPSLFNIALELLGLEQKLLQVQKSMVSRQGYSICKALRDGIIGVSYFDGYGWKQGKKEDKLSDESFWVFNARKSEKSFFNNQEYGLAWNSAYGLCRMKHIDLGKDSYEQEFEDNFNSKIKLYQQNSQSKTMSTLKIHKIVKNAKAIKIFTSIPNQGSLSEYVDKKIQSNQKLTEQSMQTFIDNFVSMMSELVKKSDFKGHGALHVGSLYVHENRIVLGEPLFITDKKEKQIRDAKKNNDYFAPEFKESIILAEKLFMLDQEKMDIWSFGFVLHYIFTREEPKFDENRKPILKRSISGGMSRLIRRCLQFNPLLRPKWSEISIHSAINEIQIQQINHKGQQDLPQQRSIKKPQQIKLDLPSSSRDKKLKNQISTIKQANTKEFDANDLHKPPLLMKQEQTRLVIELQNLEEEENEEFQYQLPPQIQSKLKRIKLTIKLILIMIMYLVLFFGPFLQHSFNILLQKDYLKTTPLNLIDNFGNTLSSVTILTAESKFFLFNDISFSQVQNKYHCINDKFDPINNPNYSLYQYVKSADFSALIFTGWVTAVIICVIKGLSIWRGGISNRPRKSNRRYWAVYIFQQLTLASLLFSHFFIYQFFYFAGISPCFYIENYGGVETMFDSSLYLFLGNRDGYMLKVFSSLGVLSMILGVSGCFYAWGPKLDVKYFTSIGSILLRMVPYILLFLICRIGVFQLFSPTALNDSSSIIKAILTGSSKGFFGMIPEVFVIICVSIEIVLEVTLKYCEQKASESDSLSRLLNIKDIKSLKRSGSYNSGLDRSLNEMSLDNSKHQLEQFN